MELKIILPNENYKKQLKHIAQQLKNNPSPFDIRHAEKIVEFYEQDTIASYFQIAEKNSSINQPEGRVPSSWIWIVSEGKIVAIADIRHMLNDYLRNVQGGHIAYEVVPEFRGKGLMNKVGKLILKYARDNFGIHEALITCNIENMASHKTIVRLMNEMGGHPDTDTIVDDHIEKRYWVKTEKED